MKTLTKLTHDKFQDIYKDPKFRNEVAFAHGCAGSNGNFKYLKTCSYPNEYIVTEEQKQAAYDEYMINKEELKIKYKNKLVFIGMGMDYAPKYPGDVGNHRIRTEFVNIHGNRYFIELGAWTVDKMRCDHSVDRTKQDELKDAHDKQSLFYNFAGLERNLCLPKYTLDNVLKLVNNKFNCKFTEIIIDSYTLSTEDIICVSPK